MVDVTQDGTDTDPESNVTRASIKQLHNFYLKHTTDSVMCLHLNAQEGHFYCTLHMLVSKDIAANGTTHCASAHSKPLKMSGHIRITHIAASIDRGES